MSLGLFGFGPGDGPGGDITVENPMTDLRRDLLQTEDVPPDAGHHRRPRARPTSGSPPSTGFSDNEWSTGDRDIPVENRADGAVPLPEIDRAVPSARSTTTR